MMTTALTLERLMLTPGFDEAAARRHAAVPAAIRDQADAAIAETQRAAMDAAAWMGAVHTGARTVGDLPGWLRLGILDAFVQLVHGSAQTCRHSPTPDSPQPVMAAAWRPGLLTCRACVYLFAAARGTDADRTCDSCGRVCTGVDERDPIHPGLLSMSAIVFQYGVCSHCEPATVAAPTTVEQQRSRPRGGRGRRRGRGRP